MLNYLNSGTIAAVAVNVAIIILLSVCIIVTGNPLTILGLYMLQPVPFMPPQNEASEEMDYSGEQGFGFVPNSKTQEDA